MFFPVLFIIVKALNNPSYMHKRITKTMVCVYRMYTLTHTYTHTHKTVFHLTFKKKIVSEINQT